MSSGNKKKVALFDICQTLVTVTTITDFMENFLLSKERNPDFSRFKWLVHFLYKIGRKIKLIGHNRYRRHFFRLFRGLPWREIDTLCAFYAEHLYGKFKKETKEVLDCLRRDGYEIVLVSAGLDVYLTPFAAKLGARLVSTVLDMDDFGVYTGKICGVDCVGEGKVQKLRTELPDFDLVDWRESRAFGDSLSDVPILSLVGIPVAVDPSPELKKYAKKLGWTIIHTNND